MTLMLDLAPTVGERLQTAAAMHDMSVSEFVTMLVNRLEEIEEQAEAREKLGPEARERDDLMRLKTRQIENRELMVELWTHRSNLQNQVTSEERMIAEYENKAMSAHEGGNRELAISFFKERALHLHLLGQTQANLGLALAGTEKAEAALRQEEDRIRLRIARSMENLLRWKQNQILEKIEIVVERCIGPADSWGGKEDWDRLFEEWVVTRS